jgi:hypothetical protein
LDLEKLHGLALISTGTLAQSPLNRARLHEFGIEDLLTSLVENNDLYLIANPPTAALLAIQATFRLKHRVSVQTVYKARFGAFEKKNPTETRSVTQANYLYLHRLVKGAPLTQAELLRIAVQPWSR